MTSPRPMIIAHRGASGYRPEHTTAAYRLAVALGADAVEPDLVASADGVLVVRHENEISGTTDVADRHDFTDRRATKEIDGRVVTGWFTEDFTWSELSTLRARERVPELRPRNARFDDRYPLLRLADVLRLAHRAPGGARPVRVVAEFKHATYFASVGLPLDDLIGEELRLAGCRPTADWLTVESFEKTFLEGVATRGIDAQRVYLAESFGAASDLVARDGSGAMTYAQELSPSGLADLAARRCHVGGSPVAEPLLQGVGVHKSFVVDDLQAGARLVQAAQAAGLDVHCFTLRPENLYLAPANQRGEASERGRWHEEFTSILGTGVDGVFADHPDLALRARDARLHEHPALPEQPVSDDDPIGWGAFGAGG